MKYFVERLDNILPRYDERIDRLEQNINSKVNNKLIEMTERFNEIVGGTPKPPKLSLLISNKLLNPGEEIKIKPKMLNRNQFEYKLPMVKNY